MNQFDSTGNYSAKKQGRTARRFIKNFRPAIDMTPMVDLGFLLISFFVITTELSRPTAMNLIVPNDKKRVTDLGESAALTVLIDGNKEIYYYEGKWQDAKLNNQIMPTDLSGKGLREVIIAKQKRLDSSFKNKGGPDELMLLIKPAKGASYKSVVDALDEAIISAVKKYTLIKIEKEEQEWLEQKNR